MDKTKKTKKNINDLMSVSIGGMAGLGVMGAMSKIPGMPTQAAGVIPMAATGVNIAQAGTLFNISKDMFSMDKSKKKCKRK